MSLDLQFFWFLNNMAGHSRIFDWIIIFLAEYLAYVLVAVFLALLFFSAYRKKKKIHILLTTTIASVILSRFVIVEIIRFFYHHPRPFMVMQVHQLIPESSWSFPSGHATFFFAMAMAIWLYNKKWGVWFFIAAILMCICRVIAGVHYPSDILGGFILGVIVAYGVYYLVEKVKIFRQWI